MFDELYEKLDNLKTDEDHAEYLVRYFMDLVKYWDELPQKTTTERLNGLLHSILVTLDGGAVATPPYILTPLKATEDGEDYFSTDLDITGGLHDTFNRLRKD